MKSLRENHPAALQAQAQWEMLAESDFELHDKLEARRVIRGFYIQFWLSSIIHVNLGASNQLST